MTAPQLIQIHHDNPAAVRMELLHGLLAPQAHTSPKYLYDALGSRLFEAITELPEYYPTRTEAAIYAACLPEMALHLPQGATLIDLGAGNCAKAERLFEPLAPRRYVAVDISVDFLRAALTRLQREHPRIAMLGVGTDFSSGLALPPEAGRAEEAARLLFYPGSSIGNFMPHAALTFLRSVHAACGSAPGSGLLIGVDLIKDTVELQAAYDDALGVTAAFNKNLLLHVNRLACTDFHVADWQHVALYDTAHHRIEMHLEATHPVRVSWPEGTRTFTAGERIHTENSYKWTPVGFTTLLQEAGFRSPTVWTDPAARFAVVWAPA